MNGLIFADLSVGWEVDLSVGWEVYFKSNFLKSGIKKEKKTGVGELLPATVSLIFRQNQWTVDRLLVYNRHNLTVYSALM